MSSKRHDHTSAAPDKSRPLSLLSAGMGLAFLSAGSMTFEVVLTHLYSEVFQYHYAFLAVSTAVLGLGFGAAISYRMKPIKEKDLSRSICLIAALIAVTLPVIVAVFIATGFVPGFVLQIILGALPFLLVGMLTSSLYQAFHEKAALLYAFDLTGSALGLFSILFLLDHISAASTGFSIGIFAAASALFFAGKNKNELLFSGVATIIAVIAFTLNISFHWVDLPAVSANNIPADKTMYEVLAQNPNAKIIDSAYSSFARVDLVSPGSNDQMYAFTNGGAGSYMIAFDGDLSKVNWLKNQVEYLPFQQFSAKNTLILGAGAGKDVLQALLAGSQTITAVEINPAMVALTRKHADFNGNILDYPNVKTVVADGRDFVQRSSSNYNMIYLNLVYSQAPAPGSNALSESYVFTTAAFKQYWQHLAANGRLAIVAHQELEGTRAMVTALQALKEEEISYSDALKHMALLMYNSSDVNQTTSVFILQKSALTGDEAKTIQTFGEAVGMSPLYLPGIDQGTFTKLADGTMDFQQFLAQSDYALFPTTDDQPFFFNLNSGLPQALQLLLVISGIGLLVFLLFFAQKGSSPRGSALVYFGGLGVGYFLVEMPLIQRSQLLAGNPTLAMVIVLGALLLGGGLGSWVSANWSISGLWKKIAMVTVLGSVFVVLFAFLQPLLFAAMDQLTLPTRLAIEAISLLPLGFLMGIPFANGLRLFSEKNAQVLPSLWGWNAITSVAGSALAASFAMLLGFTSNMLIGAACYFVVAVTAWQLTKRSS